MAYSELNSSLETDIIEGIRTRLFRGNSRLFKTQWFGQFVQHLFRTDLHELILIVWEAKQ